MVHMTVMNVNLGKMEKNRPRTCMKSRTWYSGPTGSDFS